MMPDVRQLTASEATGGHEVALRKKRAKRDIEKDYPAKQFVAKLRRLADCIEQGRRFQIQVAGERISIPPTAIINIEHERGAADEEVEFQLKWPRAQ
jgi:amphi-Trp domain-containing protein